MDLGIDGRTALITGGAGGLGRAAARDLLDAGAVCVLTDLNEERVREVAADLGERCHGVAADLTEEGAPARVVAFCRERAAMPDILVSAAGVTGAKGHPLTEIGDEDWLHAWRTDFLTAVRIMREVVPPMAERGWGRVVVVASENAVQPYWEEAVYNVAKAALLNLSKGLSRNYAKQGVLVNAVSPAFIETPMTDGMMDGRAEAEGVSRREAIEGFLDEERPYLELHRRGRPEEVAAAIAFLCSERASFVNGSNVRVDGGAVATMQS